MPNLALTFIAMFGVVCFVVVLNVLVYFCEPEPKPLRERPSIIVPGQSPRKTQTKTVSSSSSVELEDELDVLEDVLTQVIDSSSYSPSSSYSESSYSSESSSCDSSSSSSDY